MKAIATGVVALTLASSAMALDLSVTPYVQAERALEAETNTASAGFTTDLGVVSTNVQFNAFDADSNGEFAYDSTEIDFSYSANDSITIYLNNDFDSNFDHAESTVGVKVTF